MIRNDSMVRAIPLAVFIAAAGALAFAYIGEYGFGLKPCILCLYERIPYAVAGVVALLAVVLPMAVRVRAALIVLCAAVLLAGAGLAFYHVGVEEHWWTAVTGCAAELPTQFSIEDLQAQLQRSTLKPCDQVDWRLFGISLAGYNVLLSLALAVACAVGAAVMKRGSQR